MLPAPAFDELTGDVDMKTTITVSSRHTLATKLRIFATLAAALLPVMASASDGELRPAEEVYRQVCSHCHAPQYGVGPKITSPLPEAAWDAWGNYARMTVRNGRAAMPAFRQAKISDAELDGLIQALVSGELDDAPVNEE
ncbi:hypothetical protein HPA02_25060 [Bisbaumannia pacifica]|uniref:Cytochrome c domain-containing protein n=1 Tax=Bisbaumannia pacifica TaxID=77098 RepID=A0A510XA39_9GAMM|nr:cytochrome c [Halomonas pacifica]GEK48223.1 hypothetical protein HPA02_25060 [Halomonas pacifica]